MPFPFSLLCDLLNKLDRARTKRVSKKATIGTAYARIIITWFEEHREVVPREGPGVVAFLSCVFPERRPDRVFELQEKRLESIIQQAQCLGATRLRVLQNWRKKNGLDFASCVEHIMSPTDAEPKPGPKLSLEEINETLDRIAAISSFSSFDLKQKVKAMYPQPVRASDVLSRIFRRLSGSEAKWMIRMILKSYSPVQIPEELVLGQVHFFLPRLLTFQNSFEVACKLLSGPTAVLTGSQVLEDIGNSEGSPGQGLVPQIGVMITRPKFEKARSIRHCCGLAGGRRLSVERKYDGEYCQVHIDLSAGGDCIKIFSKSGRDSTRDRIGLHDTLKASLRLGGVDCVIKKCCILEGELLVWNDRHQRIEPFHKIRKYVQRSGRYIGTTRDSPIEPEEHLMIVFYDVLLFDDIACIWESHSTRRQRLRSVVQCIPGQADLGKYEMIDFSFPGAYDTLSRAFARAITQRWEGLVLKAYDGPYTSLNGSHSHIKLKKDYIPGLGDTADFAIVGGRRDAKVEQELGIGKLWWTSFYIGCLLNKNDVCRFNARPEFLVVDTIGAHGISNRDILFLNRHGYFREVPFAHYISEYRVELDLGQIWPPTDLFKDPFVVELVGAGFDKPANSRYYTLRFPRIQKIHQDRTFKDTVSLAEIQELARRSAEPPGDGEVEEERNWLEKLRTANPSPNHFSSGSGKS